MASEWFRFKQFTVRQSGAAMKVGTDGVLLGAWSRVEPLHKRYLDIGAGTGLIAMMLAQRVMKALNAETDPAKTASGESCRNGLDGASEGNVRGYEAVTALQRRGVHSGAFMGKETDFPLRIDAVEIDADSALQASENVLLSPWRDMIRIYNADIRRFVSEGWEGCGLDMPPEDTESVCGMELVTPDVKCGKYDHIISNPPWFVDSLHSPCRKRNVARHSCSLPYSDLARCVGRLLADDGIFSLVLPAASSEEFISIASKEGLEISRLTHVRTLPNSQPKRVLLEFARSGGVDGYCMEDSLTIETGQAGVFTEEYRRLTGDFYLKF